MKILWKGTALNWLSEKRNQVIYKVTEDLGISVLNSAYDYELDSTQIEDAIAQRSNVELFYIAVVKFLKSNEYPNVKHKSGLRFRVIGYEAACDTAKEWCGKDVQNLAMLIELLNLDGIRADTALDEEFQRTVRFFDFYAAFEKANPIIYIDPHFTCKADPHPIYKSCEFAFCHLNGKMPTKGKLVGIYVWQVNNCMAFATIIKPKKDFETFRILGTCFSIDQIYIGTVCKEPTMKLLEDMPASFAIFMLELI